MPPFISICIPAYNHVMLVERLLASIAAQQYKNFEVVVTDDSSDDSVGKLCEQYSSIFAMRYLKNEQALGSPANWNKSISLANGEWIKIMHHDDWFANDGALQVFATAALKQDATFIFSGFNLCREHGNSEQVIMSAGNLSSLRANPLYLFKKNYIGHPSTTLIRKSAHLQYDEKIKWVVDFEFYIRQLKSGEFEFIPEAIINIGLGAHQVTTGVFRKPEIEIPENIYLLKKLQPAILNNLLVYDYYWRMFRNLKIRSVKEVRQYLGDEQLPATIMKMITFQFKVPLSILQVGIFSKPLMYLSFLINRNK